MAQTRTRQTTEQQRAQRAWGDVSRLDNESSDKQKKYGSWARGLPALIQTNGLGQALAFLKAKGKNDNERHETLLYRHLANWVFFRLTGGNNVQPLPGNKTTNDLLEWLIHQDSGVYRRATTEALAYALWLRRFAEAKGWGDDQGGVHD